MLFRKLLNSVARSLKMKQKVRLGWAVSVVNSMTIEITAIITSKFAIYAFRSHVFIFNLGFQLPEPPPISLLLTQMAFELAIEVICFS